MDQKIDALTDEVEFLLEGDIYRPLDERHHEAILKLAEAIKLLNDEET